MYPITNEVKALFESEQRKVLRITGTDKNGATISITDNNVIADSFQIDRYACNGEKLEVGTAIAAQLTLKLENGNGQYDGIVFEGAELFVEVGIADWTQSSPTVIYIPCGYFTPDEQPRRLSTISITALDRMTKFDAVVDGTQITTPITVANLVARVCTLRGVTLAQSITGLTNANVSLPSIPSGNSVTYRNLIAWCAGIMGTNAWIDWNGQLRFSWYNNATGYASTVDNRYSSDMYENDLTVTGVVYTTTGGIDIVEGTDDYAIDLTGNTLAAPMITTILPALNTALNGFSYRPFTAAAVNAPYLWPMDAVTFTDKDGNDHASLLTNVCFGLNGTTAMEARGMTYVLNRQKLPEGFTKEQAQLINEVSNQIKVDIDDSLNQQDIFNRLTENGAAQGLVLYNGQLYINASYIQSGTLVLGGANNQNGTLQVKDANNNVFSELTNGGFYIHALGSNYGFYVAPNGTLTVGRSPSSSTDFDDNNSFQALYNGTVKLVNLYFYGPNDTGKCAGIVPIINGNDGIIITGKTSLDFLASISSDVARFYADARCDGDLVVNGDVIIDGALSIGTPLSVGNGGTGATDAAGARANLGAAADSAAMQFRGWYPNGQSMLSLTPGYYQTSSNNLPSETFPSNINPYGTLCVDDTEYTHITYISVLGDFISWALNSQKWYVVQHNGYVPVSSGGTGATTAAGARANLGVNDIGPYQAQSVITPVNDDQVHDITISVDCWVCVSLHVTVNINGGAIVWRNGIPVINNVNTNGACNYWANAQFPCRAGGLLQYRLNSNATDSYISFLTV